MKRPITSCLCARVLWPPRESRQLLLRESAHLQDQFRQLPARRRPSIRRYLNPLSSKAILSTLPPSRRSNRPATVQLAETLHPLERLLSSVRTSISIHFA